MARRALWKALSFSKTVRAAGMRRAAVLGGGAVSGFGHSCPSNQNDQEGLTPSPSSPLGQYRNEGAKPSNCLYEQNRVLGMSWEGQPDCVLTQLGCRPEHPPPVWPQATPHFVPFPHLQTYADSGEQAPRSKVTIYEHNQYCHSVSPYVIGSLLSSL